MMDDIIDDMEKKTPEELFQEFYKESPSFRQAWRKALREERSKKKALRYSIKANA